MWAADFYFGNLYNNLELIQFTLQTYRIDTIYLCLSLIGLSNNTTILSDWTGPMCSNLVVVHAHFLNPFE